MSNGDTITAPVPPAPDIRCTVDDNPLSLDPDVLFGVARRYNAKRSALFVSRVLGKHVPAEPAVVTLAGELLAARVAGRAAMFEHVDLTDGFDVGCTLATLAARPACGIPTPRSSPSPRRPRRSGTSCATASGRPGTCTPPGPCCPARRCWRSRRCTPTPPPTASTTATPTCSPTAAPWCSSTTS